MTWRTPPSLKWLITKRSRLSGALLKLDDERAKLRDKIASLDCRAGVLLKQLAALDETIGLHEIPMDPEDIRPVRPHGRARLLPHGQLSRIIFTELRLAGDWLSTTEVVARILQHLPERERFPLKPIRHCVRKRLRTLARKRLLDRHTDGISAADVTDGNSEAYWRLTCTHDSPVI
jgi:hypothetical protein